MISTRKAPQRTQRAQSASIAAPLKGWNARDAIADMDKLDAVTLTNFWPATTSVNLRNGFASHVTGITGQVETLMTYTSGSASKMFGAAGTAIYDVTSAGAVGGASVGSKTNARWQYTNFTVTGTNSYLLAVNGADKMIAYTGSAWAKDGDGAPYDVTNVDTATCTNITIFKRRIWLIKSGTLKAWYLPIDAIGGAATGLDMSSLFEFGGHLVAAMTWTLDAGLGMDDHLAFITSEGEVAVWRLTDPTTVTGISLIGIYQLGSPVGNRCWIKYGGDLLIITRDGVVPMSAALQSSRLDPRVSITDKIQFAVAAAINNYGSTFGWQLIELPKANQLYLNVPVAVGSQQQYVQNNITQAWCNFTGWAANCFEILSEDLYFGGNGVVYKAWTGTTDNGASIPGFALQAFKTYGGATQKQCKMIRYHLACNGTPAIYGNVNVDYDTDDSSAELSAGSTAALGLWDAALWDAGIWAAGLEQQAFWQGATGIGYAFAPLLKTSTKVQLQWMATDLIFEGGGLI